MIPIAASPCASTSSSYESKRDAAHAERCPSSCYISLIDEAPVPIKVHEYELTEACQIQRVPSLTDGRRSVSCIEFGAAERRFRTIRIGKDSNELLQLAEANVTQLVQIATSTAAADSNNALLARKALRYRKIWINPDGCRQAFAIK